MSLRALLARQAKDHGKEVADAAEAARRVALRDAKREARRTAAGSDSSASSTVSRQRGWAAEEAPPTVAERMARCTVSLAAMAAAVPALRPCDAAAGGTRRANVLRLCGMCTAPARYTCPRCAAQQPAYVCSAECLEAHGDTRCRKHVV